MLKSVQVLTKACMGWGEMPTDGKDVSVRVRPMPSAEKRLLEMSLGELLYYALLGDGRAESVDAV